MSRCYWLLLLILVYGCAGKKMAAEQPAPMPAGLEKLAWLQQADAERDAAKAIAEKDFRLLAISGRGTMLPGIDAAAKAKVTKQCSHRFMPGMGDVFTDAEHRKWWKKGRDYASVYNQIMVKHCLK